MSMRQTSLWLQLAPRVYGSYLSDNLKVVSSTKERPTRLEPGSVLVKVKVRIPAEVFADQALVVTVDVPAPDRPQAEVDAEVVTP